VSTGTEGSQKRWWGKINDHEITSSAGNFMAATDKLGYAETFLFSCILI
jgi:hypothetical protein